MNKLGVIVLLMVVVAGIRMWGSARPLRIADGTEVRLRFEVWSLPINYLGRWGLWYRNIWIPLPREVQISEGDRLVLTGRVESEVIGQGNKQKVLKIGDIDIRRSNKGLYDWISTLSTRLKELILSWLPGDTGALMAGIVLGGNWDLSREAVMAFRHAGLSHVTAASGYNVTVIAGVILTGLSRWVGKRRVIWIGMVCEALYVLLAGAGPAVIRAGIMVGLALAAKYWGRETAGFWTLWVSAWLMLVYRPVWLFDIGFQLSVAGTLGLLMVEKRGLESWWKADLQTTLAAQVMTVPLLVHHFGSVSVWAPLINLMTLWTVPWIMEVGLTAVAVGSLWSPLGHLIALVAWPLLVWLERVAMWAGDWPGNGLMVEKLSWWWVAGYYLVVWWGWRYYQKWRRR